MSAFRWLGPALLLALAPLPASAADGVLADLPFIGALPLYGPVGDGHVAIDLSDHERRRLPLLLDTGAQATLMTPLFARELGVSVRRHMNDRPYRRRTLLGRDLQFWVDTSSSDTGTRSGIEVGLLGGDFLRDYVVEVDYRKRRVRFLDAQLRSVSRDTAAPGEIVVPLRLSDGRPEIEIALGTGSAWFIMDTGATMDLEMSEPAAAKLGLSPANPLRIVRGRNLHGSERSAVVPAEGARIGDHDLGYVELEIALREGSTYRTTNLAGVDEALLGNAFLERFRVRIDYPHRRVGLLPRSDLAPRAPPDPLPAPGVPGTVPLAPPPPEPFQDAVPLRVPSRALRAARPAPQRVWVELESPAGETHLSGPVDWLEVRGWAGAGQLAEHDVVVIVDTSGSTAYASGADVDGDGKVGRARSRETWRNYNPAFLSSDSGDTVLAAELLATRHLVERLDPERVRVGIISFASSARLETPVGSHPEDIAATLDLLDGAFGAGQTNLAQAIELATAEFHMAAMNADGPRQRTILILSDGYPTAPQNPTEAARAALAAADAAAGEDIRIHSFALGLHAPEGDDVYALIAELTGGELVRVDQPADIVHELPRISLVQMAGVAIENATSGRASAAARAFPDGSFDGYVRLVPGENLIRATARGDLGGTSTVEQRVFYERREPTTPEEAARFEHEWQQLKARLEDRTRETELALEAESSDRAQPDKELNVRTEKD